MKFTRHVLPAMLALLGTAGAARADINVGVTVSATGPAASLGIPEKNTIELMPKAIAGQKINYIVLDDASDTTQAVSNTRKLITESKVDIVLGSTTTPNSLAMIDVFAEAETPVISLASSIVGYASWWSPELMNRNFPSKVPPGDMIIRTREGAFLLVRCNENVARELYIGTEECVYKVQTQSYRILVGFGTFLLMVSVVLLGNCNFTMQAAIGVSYIVLNGLFGLQQRIQHSVQAVLGDGVVRDTEKIREPGGGIPMLGHSELAARSTQAVDDFDGHDVGRRHGLFILGHVACDDAIEANILP